MTIAKKYLLLTALILTAITAPAYPEPNQIALPKIEFEISDQVVTGPYAGSTMPPKYKGVVFVRHPNPLDSKTVNLRRRGGDRSFLRQLSLALEGSVSPEQQQFNHSYDFLTRERRVAGQPDDTSAHILHGMTVGDIKAMVTAMITLAEDQAQAELERTRKNLEKDRNEKPLVDAEIAKLERVHQEVTKALKMYRRVYLYKDYDDALAAAQEFNKTCQLLEIEITGIKAKIEVLKPHGGGGVAGEMRFIEEIALADALARLQATKDFRDAASSFMGSAEQVRIAVAELKQNKAKSRDIEKRIKSQEKALAYPPPHMSSVQVVGKVMIYPTESSDKRVPRRRPKNRVRRRSSEEQ